MHRKQIPILFQRKENCCGCFGCVSICPKHAITMRSDEEGFEYPEIDECLCVNCRLCENVCPINNC